MASASDPRPGSPLIRTPASRRGDVSALRRARGIAGGWTSRVLLVLGVALGLPGAAPAAPEAKPAARARFADFAALPRERRGDLELRLTYLGPASRPFPSVAFGRAGGAPDPELHRLYARPELEYGTHATRLVACPLGPDEVERVLVRVGALIDVIDGGIDSLALYSFAIVDTAGGAPRCFETVLNEATTRDLLEALQWALASNLRAAELIATIGCGLQVMRSDPEGEVTGSIAVLLKDLAQDPERRRVACTLRLVNVSRRPIPGPLVVVIATTPSRVRLCEPDGRACRVHAPGTPYLVFPLEQPLTPGAAVEREVSFENPRQESFTLDPRAFVGLAPR